MSEIHNIKMKNCTSATSVILEYEHRCNNESKKIWYVIEHSAHSDLKRTGNNTQGHSLFTPFKQISLYENNISDFSSNSNNYLLNDHYIIRREQGDQENETSPTMTIWLCGGGDESTHATIDMSPDIRSKNGRWKMGAAIW
jgi:hypothetical protein